MIKSFIKSNKMNKKSTFLLLIIAIVLLLNPASCFIKTLIQGQTSVDRVFKQQIWVDVDQDDYYSYSVYSQNRNIVVVILDENQKVWTFEFCKFPNTVFFLDAYRNFIVVQQRRPGATVTYWVLTIVQKNDCFELKSFAVSSVIDNQKYDLSFGYQIRDIVEYDEQSGNLYVSVISWQDYNIYKINVIKQSPIMSIVNWFNYNKKCKEYIIAGNSRVLVEANNNQFWVDSNNTRKNNTDPSVYIKTPICKLTDKPIYPGGSKVFNLIDWYFQYVSQSEDHCKLTAFVVWGYIPVLSCQYTMTSSTPFKYWGDGYNFFIAVSNDDVYLSNVYLKDKWGKYDLYTNLLSNEIKDPKCRADVYSDFSSAKWIVYHNNYFYILTDTKFIVYSGCGNWWKKVYETKLTNALTCDDDLMAVMQDYMNSCRNNFGDYMNQNVGNDNKKWGNDNKKWGNDNNVGENNNKKNWGSKNNNIGSDNKYWGSNSGSEDNSNKWNGNIRH